MKKLILILLTAAISLSLVSCGVSETSGDSDKLKIVTTVFPQYDFARAVAAETQDSVEITMLLPPGSESHDYEPTVSDLALIEECDLFICVGGETDAWVSGVLDVIGREDGVLRLVDMVELLPEDTSLIIEDSHHGHDHAEGEACEEEISHGHEEEHTTYDEHVWTSPANASVVTDVICEAMCEKMPTLADSFRKSADEYISKLDSLAADFQSISENASRDTVIFAERFPFRYLAHDMGITCIAAFSGCSSDSEPALSTIYHLTEAAKKERVPVIFTMEFSSHATADVIADECGAEVLELHSCHNVSREDFTSGVTYAELMAKNLEAMKIALN